MRRDSAAESAAAATVSGIAVTSESTVSMPSPTSRVGGAGSPKRTASPWTRPSALRGRATGALAGREGSSQVRWTPETVPSAPVTAATSAGRRRTPPPSRWKSAEWKRSAGKRQRSMALARR